ncbi:hypothetical protein OsI_04021 [Oryza sativa Indica Group]|uniref:Uncharacterized protein n=1 Tax=Oryza sativa subsp. indica TaxID=39946 RepID=B8AAG8_ORYSI|nr:hypothetical protein OsI_04021 [Oryza sativa Indica Group]
MAQQQRSLSFLKHGVSTCFHTPSSPPLLPVVVPLPPLRSAGDNEGVRGGDQWWTVAATGRSSAGSSRAAAPMVMRMALTHSFSPVSFSSS